MDNTAIQQHFISIIQSNTCFVFSPTNGFGTWKGTITVQTVQLKSFKIGVTGSSLKKDATENSIQIPFVFSTKRTEEQNSMPKSAWQNEPNW